MGTRLFFTIAVVIIVLALMPAINPVLVNLIDEHLITRFGYTGFWLTFWHLFPLICWGYLLIILPLQILTGNVGIIGGILKRGRGDDTGRLGGEE